MSNRKTRRADASKTKRQNRKAHFNKEGDWVAPMPPEAIEILEKQRQAYRDKFGRDPGDDDPVFFDPDHDTPRPMDEAQLDADLHAALKASGAPAVVIYAFKKTGRIVTKENQHLLPPGALEEWNAALAEFAELN